MLYSWYGEPLIDNGERFHHITFNQTKFKGNERVSWTPGLEKNQHRVGRDQGCSSDTELNLCLSSED